MQEKIFVGKTIEAALAEAFDEFGVELDDIQYEVLDEGNKGFLGFLGQKEARVRVSVIPSRIDLAVEFLEGLVKRLGIEADIRVTEAERQINIEFLGDNIGLLIGYHGETLNALQYLVNVVASKQDRDYKPIVLDAEGYRQRREEALARLARKTAEKVRRYGRAISLEPMSAQERRIIHVALQNDIYVETSSKGDEPYRKVVIAPMR